VSGFCRKCHKSHQGAQVDYQSFEKGGGDISITRPIAVMNWENKFFLELYVDACVFCLCTLYVSLYKTAHS
jgi:hypothetical protein